MAVEHTEDGGFEVDTETGEIQEEARVGRTDEERLGIQILLSIIAAVAIFGAFATSWDIDEWQRLDKDETCFLHKTQERGPYGFGTKVEQLQTYCIGPDIQP